MLNWFHSHKYAEQGELRLVRLQEVDQETNGTRKALEQTVDADDWERACLKLLSEDKLCEPRRREEHRQRWIVKGWAIDVCFRFSSVCKINTSRFFSVNIFQIILTLYLYLISVKTQVTHTYKRVNTTKSIYYVYTVELWKYWTHE